MKKQLADEAIRLTSEFMEAFYNGDPNPVYAVASPDITWIGTQRGQFDIGFKEFHDDIEKILRDLTPSQLTNQRYLISQNNGCICTVIGTCHVVIGDHTGAAFEGEQRLVEALKERENVTLLMNARVTALLGNRELVGLEAEQDGVLQEIKVTGLFVAVGHQPDNGIFAELVTLDGAGYAASGEDCATKSAGVFVAGDCRAKGVRQLTTAVADGAVAALAACRYLDA